MSKNPKTELAVHAIKGGMPVKEAADAAGVHRTTLWRALKKAKKATDQLERVRGGRKREALEMLLSKQMELIYAAFDRLPPEELDKQDARFLKDLARTGTVNMGIILDKIAKHDEANGTQDTKIVIEIPGYDMPRAMTDVIAGRPVESPAPDDSCPYVDVEIEE